MDTDHQVKPVLHSEYTLEARLQRIPFPRAGHNACFLILFTFFMLLRTVGQDNLNRPLTALETKRDGKLLFVSVTLDGKGPFWFCLDSGASHSVIDSSLSKKLGLNTVSSGVTTGTGQGGVPILRAVPVRLGLGKATLEVPEPWVINLSRVPIPSWTQGLIGAELFERFVVEIDPDAPKIRLFEPDQFKNRGWISLPLYVTEHKLFVDAKLEPRLGQPVTHRLRIDTGSEECVADEAVKDGREVRETVLGQGLGSDYKGASGLMDAVHLGPFTFPHAWGPAAPKPAIGMEVFRRFVSTFDAQHRVLYLRPNSHIAEPVPAPQ
jgi:hypothetical protein